jgi:AcrR family transcriptional regulator
MNKQEIKYFNTASYMDEALLFLLEKKEYEFITVKEVCKKAGVNRSTFYLHYETMDDLLEEAVQYVTNKFSLQFKDIDVAEDVSKTILTKERFLRPYLTFIKDNKKIYRLIHDKPQLFNLDKVANSLYDKIFNIALTNYGVNEEEKRYVFAFYINGVLGVIKQWLENDCKDDIDLIIKIIERNTFVNDENHKKD